MQKRGSLQTLCRTLDPSASLLDCVAERASWVLRREHKWRGDVSGCARAAHGSRDGSLMAGRSSPIKASPVPSRVGHQRVSTLRPLLPSIYPWHGQRLVRNLSRLARKDSHPNSRDGPLAPCECNCCYKPSTMGSVGTARNNTRGAIGELISEVGV